MSDIVVPLFEQSIAFCAYKGKRDYKTLEMDDDYNSNSHLLKKPIFYDDLIKTGAYFELEMPSYNNHDDFDVEENIEDIDAEEIDHEALVSPWTRPFDELRKLMKPINEYIYKRITRVGVQEQGPVPDKARVALRYSAYWEGATVPFDSSMLRGTKFEFQTGQKMVLEGLEAAVRTMHVYEVAEFIISYPLLFREMGCPPRIKPRADGLFKIEVVEFTLIGDESSLDQIAPEDRNKFVVVYPKAQDIHLHGKDCAKRGSFRDAVTAFERAIASLNFCRLAGEEDELKQKELLIALYTNLMVCNNKLNKPSKVCMAMKALRHLTNNQPSCKALFQEARALAALGNYTQARSALAQAQAKQPNNTKISEEILNLNRRVSNYKKTVRQIWSRALAVNKQLDDKKEQNKQENLSDQQFKCDFESQLAEFEKTSLKSFNLSRKMFTDRELNMMRQLVSQHNMKLNLSPVDPDQLILAKLQSN